MICELGKATAGWKMGGDMLLTTASAAIAARSPDAWAAKEIGEVSTLHGLHVC